jgi:hypothetical protein
MYRIKQSRALQVEQTVNETQLPAATLGSCRIERTNAAFRFIEVNGGGTCASPTRGRGRKTNDEFSVPPTLLGWSQDKLARSASIGLATLRRIEQNEGIVKGNFSTIIKIQSIHFTEDDPDPDVQIPLPVLHGRASLTVV